MVEKSVDSNVIWGRVWMKIQPRMSINIKNTQSNLKVFIYFKKVDTIIYWNKGLSYVRDLIYSSALVIDSTVNTEKAVF